MEEILAIVHERNKDSILFWVPTIDLFIEFRHKALNDMLNAEVWLRPINHKIMNDDGEDIPSWDWWKYFEFNYDTVHMNNIKFKNSWITGYSIILEIERAYTVEMTEIYIERLLDYVKEKRKWMKVQI